MEDMIQELTTAIQQNWIDGKNFNQVRKRARLFGERINLSSTKIDQCASTAINQCETNPFDKVYPMLSSDAEKWLVDHNFIDVKDKIKYFSKSYLLKSETSCKKFILDTAFIADSSNFLFPLDSIRFLERISPEGASVIKIETCMSSFKTKGLIQMSINFF